jgi:hypothetical protein
MDSGNSYDFEGRRRLERVEAMLCGLITALSGGNPAGFARVLDSIDYQRVGVSRRDLEQWWEAHRKRDEDRK